MFRTNSKQSSTHAERSPALIIQAAGAAARRVALAAGRTVVGSGVNGDVVLFDDALAPAHFAIDLNPQGQLLMALEGGLALPNGAALTQGERKNCHDGLRFTAGSTEFTLCLPRAMLGRGDRAGTLVLGTAAVIIGGACVTTGLGGTLPPAMVPQPVRLAATTQTKPARPNAIEATARALAGAGLTGITLAARDDGAVAARGTITPEQAAAWAQLRREFDGQFGDTVLVDDVSPAPSPVPLAIQAVWPGSNPYVIDGDGQKLFVGAMLRDGWSISAIESTRVLVARGSQTVAVRF